MTEAWPGEGEWLTHRPIPWTDNGRRERPSLKHGQRNSARAGGLELSQGQDRARPA